MSKPASRELLQQYEAGQDEAATAIFNRYVERLMALARSRISPKLKRRIDPEDVVQSAYRSFFVHAKNQEYQLTRSGDLWRLLATTTLNKLYGQAERQTAAKRTIDREIPGNVALANLETHDPTVVEIVAVGEQLRLVFDSLSHDERLVLMSTLQGESVEEIRASICKSERTVRRLLKQARHHFEQRLLDKETPANVNSRVARSQVIEPNATLKFSDYVLEELLGAGGMGKVYRAIDKRSGKTVAVKSLHKSRQSEERAVAQFVQEAQILAKMRHSNIVGVQGLGRFPAGGYFIVMDYIDGSDLQSQLDEGPLPLVEVVAIVKKVANAVQHAHERGIVHCDLKPGNILVDKAKNVFVTDFGFALMIAGASTTATNAIGGTVGYMAPEVAGLRSWPTQAADLYSIGAVLWTLATGRLPEVDTLRAEKRLPASLKSICGKCLANDPSQRYPDAASLVSALTAWSVE